MTLSPKAITLSASTIWGFAMLFVGLIHMANPAYGGEFLRMMSSVYPGADTTPRLWRVLLGTLYGLVDGAVAPVRLALSRFRADCDGRTETEPAALRFTTNPCLARWRTAALTTGAALFPLISSSALLATAIAHPDVHTIMERSVQASDADWAAAPLFDFTEQDRIVGGTITYQIRMIFGTPYYDTLLRNGKPLPPVEARQEQARLRATITHRRAESPKETAERLASYQKSRARDHLLMSQLSKAFIFKLLREQTIGPYRTWVLKATPLPGYRPPNLETQALSGMTGTLWIDTETYQWVKVEARVVRPVAIASFLARVEPGTQFELEKAPVTSDIWLPRHFSMTSRAKVVFLFNHHSQVDETYFGYHRCDPLLQTRPVADR